MENEHTHGQGAQTGGHDHPAREGHKPDCGCEGHDHHAGGHAGHDHGPDCGCEGHDHRADGHAGHDHGPDCGCGEHAHAHHHGPGCGCEWHEHDDVTDGPDYDNGLSIAENNVLMALLERGGLPVARFALTSSREQEAYTVAMGPVYIADPEDSLDTIRGYGAIYAEMEHKGLIDLDYDFPLPGYAYREYRESSAWKQFQETAAEASRRGFTYDTPHLELGGITLTERGQEVVDNMIG